jgi:hypothetical protein
MCREKLILNYNAASLQTFARLVGEPHSKAFDISKARAAEDPSIAPSTVPSENPSLETLPNATSNDAYLLQQIYTRQDSIETLHSLYIDDLLPVIKDATADLREACCDGVSVVQAGIDHVNKYRWRTDANERARCHEKFDATIARLSAVVTSFKETKHKMLIEPFMPLLRNAHTREARNAVPLRSLYLSYVFAANIIVVGDVLLAFVEQVRATLEKRKNNRLWAPKGIRAINKFFTERDHEDAALFGEDQTPEKTEIGIKQESYREYKFHCRLPAEHGVAIRAGS